MQLGNQKHLTLEDRNYIEQALNQNMAFKEKKKGLKYPKNNLKSFQKAPFSGRGEYSTLCTIFFDILSVSAFV